MHHQPEPVGAGMSPEQLELMCRIGPTKPDFPRRLSRANWWFNQMREVVDRAVDWQPAKACGQPEPGGKMDQKIV